MLNFNVDTHTHYNLEEDEQLARALQESLNAESPPRRNVPIEDVPVPPRWDVPVERVPPRQYVPASEPPPYIYPQSGSRYLFFALIYLIFSCKN